MQLKLTFSLLSLASMAAAQNPPNIIDLLTDTPQLSSLLNAAKGFPDLVKFLGTAKDITILAPSNDAFAAFASGTNAAAFTGKKLEELLTYHVLNGSYPSSEFSTTPKFLPSLLSGDESFKNLTGSQVVKAVIESDKAVVIGGLNHPVTVNTADVKFDNGIVHIVDSVILPPFSVSATAKAANLTDLVNALVATNLAGAVDSMKDVTIFAPTNMAFGATPENLTVAQLSEILTFHVVPNAVAYSTSLKDGQNITTLAGKQLTVKITDGVVSVNGAKVIAADVLVNSGVVHVIDAVLSPATAPTAPKTSTSATSIGALPTSSNAVGKTGASVFFVAAAGAFAFAMAA